jgi:hypothetical protein
MKEARPARLNEQSPKGGVGKEAPRGCATERALKDSARQCAPAARLCEEGVRVRHADIVLSTSVASERAGADRGSKGPQTAQLYEPGPKGGGGEEAPGVARRSVPWRVQPGSAPQRASS